jgi:hypothetical protein
MGRLVYLFLVMISLIGCAALGSMRRTNSLAPGMSTADVQEIIGRPIGTEFVHEKWIWKYRLHEYGKGYVPFYAVFNRESMNLESWISDEEEYARNQEMWLRALSTMQRKKIDLTIEEAP